MIFSKARNSCTLHLFICLLWLLWITSIHVKAVSDTLNPGEALNSSTALCSMNGKYCLYFAKYDDLNSYLAIRCSVDDWVVWANRKLFHEEFAVLSLDHNGVLKIETQNEEPMILYSSPQQNIDTVAATLLDTGNFVLREISTGEVLWQSFDSPADTLLPGMKLGVDHKGGYNWSVVSFLGGTMASGPFRLEWEPSEGELVIKRHGNVCWKSGRLNIDNRFEQIPEEVQRIYEYSIVSNVDEKYFTFATDPNDLLAKWTLLDTGQLLNKKGDDIARADMCYGYNTNGGCQKWEDIPSCRDHGDEFVTKEGYPNYSSDNVRFDSNSSNGISDCKASCWKDCTCFGFTTNNENETGCIFFLNSTKGINFASGGQSFYVLAKNNSSNNDSNNYPKGSGSGTKNWKWKIAVLASTLLIVFPFLVLKLRKHNLKEKDRNTNLKSEMLDLEASSVYSIVKDLCCLNKGHDLKVFSYASITKATNDFSSENKLGQGGFGPVYKGTLPNGEVAVKRLSRTSGQGIVEFKNELALISELQHTNLVQLLGHCINKQERMLVYEYMPNKSLDFFLFDSTQSKLLDWNKRFRIIEGIAQGLLYLHKYSRVKIIHRDLKASNILLDKDMNPKISDFGIARMFTQHETEANTNKIVGTIGYMSPEYFMDGIFSLKSDVYSFGVLLLEIISGRRNKSFYTDERPLNLVGHAWELWKQGKVIQLVDPALNESFDKDEVIRCIHIGLLCVEENANDRPCMSTIISLLTNKNSTSSVPKRPAYYVRAEVSEDNMAMSKEFDSECIFENSLYHEC